MADNGFEPLIIGFYCNWCSYAGADLAGTSRIQYPSNIRIIRIMCSGMISDNIIMEAFTKGADGIILAGCHPGDCHYMQGNIFARRRVSGLKPFLEAIGIGSDRLRLEWISTSEGAKMAEIVKEFTDTIRALGPNRFRANSTSMEGNK